MKERLCPGGRIKGVWFIAFVPYVPIKVFQRDRLINR